MQAWQAGIAPPVVLESTHVRATEIVPLEWLQASALNSAGQNSVD
jgi:uncharacterized protein (DUF2237 family)